MYLWRRLAAPQWLEAKGDALRLSVGEKLATIERPNHPWLILEAVCRSREEARRLKKDFGGQIDKLPRDWLGVFAREQVLPLLRIGRRLIISDGEGKTGGSRSEGPSHLVIPAGAAFGTGGHLTTAMTLRLLEQVTRGMERGWSLADLGTGSGILALAARHFGAATVIAIDNDPTAISTARANARLNGIRRVDFQLADVRRWRPKGKVDVVTANLFSELLIETTPRLSRFLAGGGQLIVSGILRSQESEVSRALRRTGFQIIERRRRGKWVALLFVLELGSRRKALVISSEVERSLTVVSSLCSRRREMSPLRST